MSVSNFENKKLIAKNAIFLYIRMIISTLLGLFTSRFVLRALGVEDYGIYNLVGGFVSLLGVFTASINGSCQRFLTYQLGQDNKKKLNDTFCTISFILIATALIVFVLGGIIGFFVIYDFFKIPDIRMQAAIITFLCSLCTFCLELISIPYTSLIIAHEKMDFYAIVNLGESLAKFGVALCMLQIKIDELIFYSICLLCISLFARIIYSIYCRLKYSESLLRLFFDKKIFKKIFSFSAWIGLGSFAGILKDQGGGILLNLIFGLTFNAAAGIAFQVKGLIANLANNLSLAITPQITKTYASNQKEKSFDLTFMLAKSEALFMLLIIIPLLFNTRFLLELWLKNVPSNTVIFTQMIAIFCFTNIFGLSYGPLFMAAGKVKSLQIRTSIIVIMVIPISYALYKFDFPPVSYYAVCIISELTTSFMGFFYLFREINFPILLFLKNVYLKIICICLSCFIFMFFVSNFFHDLNDWVKLFYSFAIYILSAIFIGLNKNERIRLFQLALNKIRN